VDVAAQTVSEFLLKPSAEQLVLHLENPVRQPWADMCTIIERQLGISSKRIPYSDWLHEALTTGGDLENLEEFFSDYFIGMSSGSLVLSTDAARSVSPTLRSVGAVNMDTVKGYLSCWKRQGLLI
jgi:hypothetical protein